MEIKANSSDLLKALNHIHGIVEVRHTLPILSNILLDASNSKLTITATDLDLFTDLLLTICIVPDIPR